MAIKKRNRKKRESDLQRRDQMAVDLSGDSLEEARKRTDNLLRNILNFMPGEIEVRVFTKFDSSRLDDERAILNEMFVFVSEGYQEHISRIGQIQLTPSEESPAEGSFELVLCPNYKKS